MKFENYGTLSVRCAIAGGSIPIKGAVVHVRGASEENRFVNYSLTTDNNGITAILRLPAPSAEYSLLPNPKVTPYALYDVEISEEDFLKKNVYNVAVFADVNTFLPVNMIPKSLHKTDVPTPNENLNTVIK